FNNRIGVALTILSARSGTKHLVLELGTSGRGEISHLSRSVRPERVVVTDIAPAHLLGLSDMDGVVAAKAEIFDGFTGRGSAWVRAGITGLDVFAARARSRLRTFGWRKKGEEPTPDLAVSRCVAELSLGGDDVRVGYRFQIGDVELFLPVLGRHNVLNALGAIAVARECGLGFREIQRGLDSVSLPPRRLELVAVGPTLLIDDSYNANPRSFAGALDAWRELRAASPGRGVVVFGDMLELGDRALDHHEEAGRAIAASDVELLVCVGDYAGVVAESFREARATEGAGPGDVIVVDAAPAAIDALSQRLRAGDRILVKGSNASGAGAVAQAIRELLRADAGARAELREAAR
ncbi:MAG TPA: UDP-N-acetylmuramoyl-tripeptide--D-alanyl-D-alanine ligase, partial [Planctomycetota bacterium]|nr:UDP-N-acetylmuramoyl-tripeptide--D-alanyl-D-alanine ligase [Planctomycetota bacterium]